MLSFALPLSPPLAQHAPLARDCRVPKEELAMVSDLRYSWKKLRRLAMDVSDTLTRMQVGFKRTLIREVKAFVIDAHVSQLLAAAQGGHAGAHHRGLIRCTGQWTEEAEAQAAPAFFAATFPPPAPPSSPLALPFELLENAEALLLPTPLGQWPVAAGTWYVMHSCRTLHRSAS